LTTEGAVSIPTGGVINRLRTGADDTYTSLSMRLVHLSGVEAYAEYGIRNVSLKDNTAYLIGTHYALHSALLILDTHLEYRYYGSIFNFGWYEPAQVAGRDSSGAAIYASNAGRYHLGNADLYPIELYDHPFSQWAVFTDYQGVNVSGITFYADLKIPIYQSLFFKGLLDWNRIEAQGHAPFVYPFFACGLGWEPFAGVSFLYSLTNRTMNLDRAYPTLYLLKYPSSEMRMMWDLHL